MLAIITDPKLLVALIPLGIIVLGVLTFEAAMAITISTLPRSRFRHKWTPQEQRRVVRVFAAVFSVWPLSAALIVAHAYLPGWSAVIADALALAVLLLGLRWLLRRLRHKKLVLAGHCANCLYDLRASRDRDQCPECGIDLANHPTRIAINR